MSVYESVVLVSSLFLILCVTFVLCLYFCLFVLYFSCVYALLSSFSCFFFVLMMLISLSPAFFFYSIFCRFCFVFSWFSLLLLFWYANHFLCVEIVLIVYADFIFIYFILYFFFFYCFVCPRCLHSFPSLLSSVLFRRVIGLLGSLLCRLLLCFLP